MAGEGRPTFSAAEAEEVRGLIHELFDKRLPQRRVALARLRRIGFAAREDDAATLAAVDFDGLVQSGAVSIDANGDSARARIQPHPSGRIFRVAVGVTGHPVDATWSAFDRRYQWFGKAPKNVARGDHLFVLAVDRWKSAVVGLYEAVSAGADRLPDSPDPNRWPWAVGVRPLAAVPPPQALRVEAQIGPQSGLPEQVYDASVWPLLYDAVSASPPPPGPRTTEQRVQELEWQDVSDDVLAAVRSLGSGARRPGVVEHAVELGGWTSEELDARAWYTGFGDPSHIRQIVTTALEREYSFTRRLGRRMGGLYFVNEGVDTPGLFGVSYRRASSTAATVPDRAPHEVDLSKLDAATARHMSLQDEFADQLIERGIEPRSPASWQPQFDLAFEHEGRHFVVEVKTGYPVSTQQTRLGVGQVLEYCHVLRDGESSPRPVLLLEGEPPSPWPVLLHDELGISVIRADGIVSSLNGLLSADARAGGR